MPESVLTTLAVWTADRKAGLLERSPDLRQYVFNYDPAAEFPVAQVSLTMPIRLESWVSRDLHPIFQMNLRGEPHIFMGVSRYLRRGLPVAWRTLR